MDLVEFLLARIVEDQGGALIMPPHPTYADRVIDKAFILAECEAKRRIVTDCYQTWLDDARTINGEWGVGILHDEDTYAYDMLKVLAVPYADHPDYRDEWRP